MKRRSFIKGILGSIGLGAATATGLVKPKPSVSEVNYPNPKPVEIKRCKVMRRETDLDTFENIKINKKAKVVTVTAPKSAVTIHRCIQTELDNPPQDVCTLDITDTMVSYRYTDNWIRLANGWVIKGLRYVRDGSIETDYHQSICLIGLVQGFESGVVHYSWDNEIWHKFRQVHGIDGINEVIRVPMGVRECFIHHTVSFHSNGDFRVQIPRGGTCVFVPSGINYTKGREKGIQYFVM